MALTGWRCWYVPASGVALRSPVVGAHRWEPGSTETADRCLRCKRESASEWPNENCHCGFYSFIDPQECVWQSHAGLRKGTYILGTIKAWGRVVPHKLGQRSSRAQITGLYLWPDTSASTIELLLKYPVPIQQAQDQPWWLPVWLKGRPLDLMREWSVWHASKFPEEC